MAIEDLKNYTVELTDKIFQSGLLTFDINKIEIIIHGKDSIEVGVKNNPISIKYTDNDSNNNLNRTLTVNVNTHKLKKVNEVDVTKMIDDALEQYNVKI